MPQGSQFWRDRLAGKPRGRAWAENEARAAADWWTETSLPSIRAAVRRGEAPDDVLPMRVWVALPERRQQAITKLLIASTRAAA